jgi:hypothetical protein
MSMNKIIDILHNHTNIKTNIYLLLNIYFLLLDDTIIDLITSHRLYDADKFVFRILNPVDGSM